MLQIAIVGFGAFAARRLLVSRFSVERQRLFACRR